MKKLDPKAKKCKRGHLYAEHKYKDTNKQVRCRACTKLGAKRYYAKLVELNARRAKAKKGAVKKLHGNYAGEKKARAKKPAPVKAKPVVKKATAPAAIVVPPPFDPAQLSA